MTRPFVLVIADFRGIENIGPFFTVYALVLLFSRPVMGRMADRYGAGPLLISGILMVAAALFILMHASALVIFLLAAVLYGLGFGAVQPMPRFSRQWTWESDWGLLSWGPYQNGLATR